MESPPPVLLLTTWQKRLLWITFLLVVFTRGYALSRSLWDWDEAQFAAAVDEYSVERHHPHPPGFPLYILAAKIARPFVPDEFRALQAVTFAAACALFPLAFLLAREMGFPYATSYAGALLFVFLPNVWFFGGTGFSDISGVAACLAAAFLLLRGRRDARSYLAGAAVLGVAAGIRSQALLIGFAPFAVASWAQLRQSWRRVLAACAIVAAITAASYAGAALASESVGAYRVALQGVRDWVRKVDSFVSPTRPPLAELAGEFFVRPMAAGRRFPIVLSLLAALGLCYGVVRSRRSVALAVATFAPFALFAWLMLDRLSIHRYSTAYIFLWTLLAAHAAALFAMPFGRWSDFAQVAAMALLTARSAWWTIPALREVRRTDSPPYAAMQSIRQKVPPGQPVWVDGSLAAHSGYLLADRDVRLISQMTARTPAEIGSGSFFVTEGMMPAAMERFVRPRDRVWDIARRRYFEAVIVHSSNVWAFGSGWYDQENDGETAWRWMGTRSEAWLPLLRGRARLMLALDAISGITPDVEVRLNDVVLARFRCGQQPVRQEWLVEPRGDGLNRLVITSSESVNLAKAGLAADSRDLSLRLTAYAWRPSP